MVAVIWIMTGNGPSNNRLDGKKRASLEMDGIKEEKGYSEGTEEDQKKWEKRQTSVVSC